LAVHISIFCCICKRSKTLFVFGRFLLHKKIFSKSLTGGWQFYNSYRFSGKRNNPSPAFSEAKGGEYVNSQNHMQNEQGKKSAFDSFCKKVLKNEVRDYYDEVKRLRSKEVSISELSAHELGQLSTTDEYFTTEQTFNVLGLDVIVNSESIAAALRNLPERKRDIILLSYFLELSDREVGEKLNMMRSTVQYQRTSTLQELKKMMEEESANE